MDINSIVGAHGPSPSASTSLTPDSASGDFAAALISAKKNHANNADDPVRQSRPVTKTAFQELEEYLRKSEAQRLREKILNQLGLTEDALNAMPPKERAAVENAIAQKIKEYLLSHRIDQQETGQPALSTMKLLA